MHTDSLHRFSLSSRAVKMGLWGFSYSPSKRRSALDLSCPVLTLPVLIARTISGEKRQLPYPTINASPRLITTRTCRLSRPSRSTSRLSSQARSNTSLHTHHLPLCRPPSSPCLPRMYGKFKNVNSLTMSASSRLPRRWYGQRTRGRTRQTGSGGRWRKSSTVFWLR